MDNVSPVRRLWFDVESNFNSLRQNDKTALDPCTFGDATSAQYDRLIDSNLDSRLPRRFSSIADVRSEVPNSCLSAQAPIRYGVPKEGAEPQLWTAPSSVPASLHSATSTGTRSCVYRAPMQDEAASSASTSDSEQSRSKSISHSATSHGNAGGRTGHGVASTPSYFQTPSPAGSASHSTGRRSARQGNILNRSGGSTGGVSVAGPVYRRAHMERLELKRSIQAEVTKRQEVWLEGWAEAEQSLLVQMNNIQLEMKQKEENLCEADSQLQAEQQRVRDQRLSELQRHHQKATAQQLQQVERLQKQAREEAERQRRLREEADKAAAAAAAAAAEKLQRDREEELMVEQEKMARKKAQEAAAAEAAKAVSLSTTMPSGSSKAGVTGGSGSSLQAVAPEKAQAASKCLRACKEAIKWEDVVHRRFIELQGGDVEALMGDEGQKKARREVEKKMNVHVQQISATQDQTARKIGDVYQLIRAQPNDTWRTFAMLQFAIKATKQYDLIAINNKAAFPIAQVIVKVSTQFPALMDIMLGLLHREVLVSVPMSFVNVEEAHLTPGEYRRLLRYKEVDQPDGGKAFESTEDLLKRVQGLMLLYGAIVQVEDPAHPHGLEYGWKWLSRALNALPADRISAKALACFMSTAGFALYRRYRSQFVKLLQCLHESYLTDLSSCKDTDVEGPATLLHTYCSKRRYLQEPDGWSMPRVDESTYTRAD
ncbi:hypothetical protein CEUSTIGMA_g2699.t1 [Chlamydomonas eustigma]|uniref:mRNA export factor GLE1 n=1 Tax=Chlamydomonas eustigma TaxID=1157962 RepID=A0A250WWP1_9CHLO|nr:hypothetical protein CEUSTIGMA_g2699.t1 [Chlamydomonas eustigma]|eukprot:GAX75254.1 hypothetical protein CEUSTIGMA_g2699.t1 [Chlamydomonas eustigma]